MSKKGDKIWKTVSDIMASDVATISSTASVVSAAGVMNDRNIGSVVVVDDNRMVGILTERDLLTKIIVPGKDPAKMKAKDIMSSPVISAGPDISIIEAAKLMEKKSIKKLPIIKDKELLGIITEVDIANAMRSTILEIIPVTENKRRANPKHKIKIGTTYIIREVDPAHSYDMFVDKVMQGAHGLCITRDHPEKIKTGHGLEKTPILWLTDVKSPEHSISPYVGELSILIHDFIDKSENSVILLDGLDYLITRNNYTRVLQLIQDLRDKASASGSTIIIPIDKDTLDDKELRRLEQGTEVVEV